MCSAIAIAERQIERKMENVRETKNTRIERKMQSVRVTKIERQVQRLRETTKQS